MQTHNQNPQIFPLVSLLKNKAINITISEYPKHIFQNRIFNFLLLKKLKVSRYYKISTRTSQVSSQCGIHP